jgi:RNA polymerase sigma factor (TIGR02999 family)
MLGMAGPSNEDITQMLAQARDGDEQAWMQVVALVYGDLRRIAHRQIAGSHADATLNTTGLVHECYLRLMRGGGTPNDRNHFLSLAARVMRQVIIDHARERLAHKRNDGERALSLEDVNEAEFVQAQRFVALDDALTLLAAVHPHYARIVECRFFAGLTEQETADALDMSLRVVQRDWHEARRWLAHQLEGI